MVDPILSVLASASENISNRKLPWVLFCFLTVMFFFAQIHSFQYSQHIAEQTEVHDSQDTEKKIKEGNKGRRISIISLGLFGIYCLMRQRGHKLRINGFIGFATIFFFLWIFLSIFWSGEYVLTVRRSISFMLLWIAALGFNMRFTERETYVFLLFASLSYILFGLSVELSLGTFLPLDINYRFTGTIHPNFQAWNCAGAALAGVVLWDTEPRRRSLFLVLAIIAFIALVLTKSRSGLAAFLLALLIYAILVSKKERMMFYTIGVVSLLCLVPLIFGPETFGISRDTLLLGRMADFTTLTGRIPVWSIGMDYVFDKPLLGYGFNAFESAKRLAELETKTGWAAMSMHSEYLNLLLGVGIIGLITYLLIILGTLLRTMYLFRISHSKYHAIACSILVFCIGIMLLENLSAKPNVVNFIFFVIIARRGFIAEQSFDNRYP